MSRKFVQQEGPKWIDQGIVSREQYERILSLYSDKNRAVGLLPILGSILLGLGILSFVAANWQDIFPMVRFAIIVAAMAGFYTAGDYFHKRNQRKLGLALTGLGVFSFGGGIFLIGQMFHLTATNAATFLVWGTAGALSAYLYRSKYLFLLSTAIFLAGQIYSIGEFHNFSYATFAVMLITLVPYWRMNRSPLIAWLMGASFVVQSALLIAEQDLKFAWTMVPVMFVYMIGDVLRDPRDSYPLQSSALVSGFLFGIFVTMFYDQLYFFTDLLDVNPVYFLPAAGLLFVLSAALKFRQGRVSSAAEWVLFLPLFLLAYADVYYMIVLFAFSLYVLWRGYAEEWSFKINLGTVLFIASSMLAYAKLTWGFMGKSMFFVIGGILLLGLSWVLNRRRREFLSGDDNEGGDRDEK